MRSAILIVILMIGRTICSAQTVDGNLLGGSINLGSKWLYHEGDNDRWSRPDLRDEGWKPVSTEVGPYARSNTPDGFFWYRLHVRIPAAHLPLRMLVDETGNPYEVFVNGIKIGALGEFPPNALRLRNLVQKFDIPDVAASGDSLVIAFRFWNRSNDWGGLRGLGRVRVGSHDDIKSAFAAERGHIMASWIPDICVRFLSLALAAGLLVLYRWNPQLKEYPWIAAYFFAMTAWTLLLDYRSVAPIDLRLSMFLDLEFVAIGYAALLQFAFAFLRRPMPIWLRIYQLSLIFQPLVMFAAFRGWADGSAADLTILIWNVPYAFLLPGIVFWRYLKGQAEAGLLAIPLLLINLE